MTRSEQVIKQNFSKTNGTPSVAKVGSNAPKATLEQLNLARLLTTNSDDRDRQFKLEQIQECTECDLEEAVLALHDADGNVQRAIENLIDAKRENDWQDTFTKRSKSKRHGAQKSKVPTAVSVRPKGGSSSSLSDGNANMLSDNVEQKPLKMPNGKKSTKQAANGQSRNGPSNEVHGNRKASHSESTHVEGWGIECGEWKGEAIEVVNSAVNIPINIHDDTELLKLLTLESVETSEKSDETMEQAEVVKDVEVKSVELKDVKKAPSKPQSEDQVKIVRDRLFKKYARSLTPPPSHVPSTPVFFAPGARNTALIENVPAPEGGAIQVQAINRDRSSGSDARVDQDADLPRSGQISKGKSLNNENSFDSHDRIKSPSQCNFSPAVNTLLQSVRNVQPNLQIDQTYATSLQNTSAHKEPYAKVQDHGSPHSRTQAHSVNNFEGSKSYSYNLLGDLPPTVKQVSLELQVGKSDAFTQSISSTQSENVVSAPYNMQTTKQSVGQPPQMNKPMSTMPPNANQQSLPTNQPQLHHVMHPAFPTLLSHLQPNMSLFNFPGGSGPAAPPHLFDMDHFQALQQQQRMLFEMQQSQHPPQHTQTVANENNLPNSASDVISSTKSTVPMHQVTTANVGSGITFLPYSGGMVFMNGYPNAYLGQQQPQAGGSQNQSPGHGGSPLSHPPSQQQYPKSMNAPVNYAGYQGLRQSSFEDVGDMLYSNLAKQMAYKHTSGVQSFYNPPMQQPSKAGSGPDLSLGGKLQQQAPGLPSAQQPQVPNAAPGVQPQALYTPQAPGQYPFFSQPCMAMAAAAAAAQNQQQSQGPPPPGTPGSNGVDRWCPYVFDLGFYDPLKSGSIDGIVGHDIPPHDRAVCSAQSLRYRPSKGAFPESVFKLWKNEDVIEVSLFIGRLHPSVKYEELRSAFSRLLAEIKKAEAEVEQRRSRRHHNRHYNRDRSPWQRENSGGSSASLWPLVRVVKHPITGVSRGYAFAWFESPRDARRVLDTWRASSSLFCPKRFALGDGVKVDLAQIFGDMPCWEQLIVEPSFSRSLPGWKPRRLGGGLGGMKESGQLRFGGIARPFRRPFRSFRDGEG